LRGGGERRIEKGVSRRGRERRENTKRSVGGVYMGVRRGKSMEVGIRKQEAEDGRGRRGELREPEGGGPQAEVGRAKCGGESGGRMERKGVGGRGVQKWGRVVWLWGEGELGPLHLQKGNTSQCRTL